MPVSISLLSPLLCLLLQVFDFRFESVLTLLRRCFVVCEALGLFDIKRVRALFALIPLRVPERAHTPFQPFVICSLVIFSMMRVSVVLVMSLVFEP